jgi:3-hydroxyacyl-[acyl-carrier-protein] dehydratase
MAPGQSITAVKKIDPNEEFFRDHFPGFPVVPGVLLTEMMAQAAGKCLDGKKTSRGKAMLAQIKSASFRDWVSPGEEVIIYATITMDRNSFAVADCHIKVQEKKVCNAELFFTFLPFDKLAPEFRDDVLESYLSSNLESPSS